MQINKNYSLYSIELTQGSRILEYNSKLWKAIYTYKGKERDVELSVERYWKALRKYHKLYIGEELVDNDIVAPVIFTDEQEI